MSIYIKFLTIIYIYTFIFIYTHIILDSAYMYYRLTRFLTYTVVVHSKLYLILIKIKCFYE